MDTAARIGGEEFAVILPECTPEDAIRASTRIHRSLTPMAVPLAGTTVEITVSGGLVWTDPRALTTASMLLTQADQEMYRAKHSGRRILCHPPVVVTEVSVEERKAFQFGQAQEVPDGS
jgi:diguanylate cyclase (GGDEF)-like protein